MPQDKDSEVLDLLQPDLLTPEQLVDLVKARCPKVQNPSSLSKERLVSLFRQVILPLPQRHYRPNRRGKLLSARRVKSGLEASSKGEEDPSSRSNRGMSNAAAADNDDDDRKTPKKRPPSNEKLQQETCQKKPRTAISWP